ncbi:unnamed protein product [Clavelina lepadiformis]|uniref:Guanine nucleotide exchange factor VAV2 n=1 Tax=Clavelina lepadiformis TaxID=159417 RepID=A0ABP0F7U7_CLALP
MGRELWRDCVHWLGETGVLPRDHKTTYRDAQVFDLAQTLRDGVVLCNLLNAINPGAVDFGHVNTRPQMLKFLCIQNLRTVLYSLQNVFRIAQQDLFQPNDLYDMTNVKQVLKTLSALSHQPISSSKFRPFPLDTGQPHRNSLYKSEDEEEIYRNLPDMASERELVDEEEDLYDCVPAEDREEGIYGSLIAFKPQSASAPTSKRSFCINEIAETESNYVQHLEMMLKKFVEPLRKVLEPKDIKIIFINYDQLLPVHQDFLKSIQKEKAENSGKMSQAFLSFKDRFLLYGTYCSRLTDAQEHLKEVMSGNESIKIAVENCQNKANPSKFRLRELLCVPMQRILKYHLLVKELNKNTNDSHNDKSDLAKALDAMQELSKYVNEVKRDSEMVVTINQFESCLLDYTMQLPLHTYGHLLKDGELKVKNSSDRNSKSRFTMLFDQAIFMTSEKNGMYKLKDLVRLEDYTLDEMPQSKANKWSWNFSLTATKYGSSLTLYTKNQLDKAKWLENIKSAYDNIKPLSLKSKPHSFRMHTFKDATYCDNCNKLLLGSFFQGYFCERTNLKCHKLCLAEMWRKIENHEAPAPSTRGRPQPLVPAHSSAGFQCKAHRDYNGFPSFPSSPGAYHLRFQTGEHIEVDEKVNSEWWLGHTIMQLDRQGYFPASYVHPLDTGKPWKSSKGNYYPMRPIPFTPTVGDHPSNLADSFTSLEDAPWYAGTMDRGKAADTLEGRPSGTFLVRSRDNHLAISLTYNNDPKHIKINQSPDKMFYVAEYKNFKSVQDLVRFYQENTMSSSFLGLETTLKLPYRDPDFFPGVPPPLTNSPRPSPNHRPQHRKSQPVLPNIPPQPRGVGVSRHHSMQMTPPPRSEPRMNGTQQRVAGGRNYDVIGQATVLYDFQSRSSQELGLRKHQVVNVISKAGDERGWWKGECDGRVGYFPASFIHEI